MKLQARGSAILLKRDSNTCVFTVNIVKFLRTTFDKEHLQWLVLVTAIN